MEKYDMKNLPYKKGALIVNEIAAQYGIAHTAVISRIKNRGILPDSKKLKNNRNWFAYSPKLVKKIMEPIG